MKQMTRRVLTMMLAAVVAVTAILMTAPDSGAVTYKKLNLGTVEAKKWKTSSKIKAPVITSHKVIRRTDPETIANLTKKNESYMSWWTKVGDITIEDEKEDPQNHCYTNSIDKTKADDTITINLSWKKVGGAAGYEVRAKQTYAGKTDEHWRYARTKSNSVNLYTYWKATGLGAYFWFASDASYKIQVRAYKKVGKTYQYGKWSDTIKITGNETIGDVIGFSTVLSGEIGFFADEIAVPDDADGALFEYGYENGEINSITAEAKPDYWGRKKCVVKYPETSNGSKLTLLRAKAYKKVKSGEVIYSKNWYYPNLNLKG